MSALGANIFSWWAVVDCRWHVI